MFYHSGDIEKERNLPVSTFYDRANTSIPNCQVGFIDVLVLPLFAVLGQFVPEIDSMIRSQIQENKNVFTEQDAMLRSSKNKMI